VKYLISIGIVLVNLLVIVYACAPLFVTFAKIPVSGVGYDIGNRASIERALSAVRTKTIEEMRVFWSQFIWPLAVIAAIDTAAIVIIIFRRSKGG
jgi:glucan phosphoethanolaminetransferase (alkaline phosphatase superfamily)